MEKPYSHASQLCEACSARHRGICGALTRSQLDELSASAHRRRIDAGEPLVNASDPVSHFSVIVEGAVKLSKMLPDGRQQIVGMQYAPDFLGRPFLPESDVAVDAVTDATLCRFPRTKLERMIERSPDLERRLFVQALAELDEARELLLTLGQRTARERVSSFLLFVLRQTRRKEANSHEIGRSVNLLLTRAEIADFLGLTIETVSRQLHKLKDLGIIEIEHNRGIRVLDAAGLQIEAGDAASDETSLRQHATAACEEP